VLLQGGLRRTLLWGFYWDPMAVRAEKQISPLRCAPVEMTVSFRCVNFTAETNNGKCKDKCGGSSLRSE
jgi:hypothetical protein